MAAYFYLDQQNQKRGPLERPALEQLLEQGQIHHNTLVWCEGMAGWEALGKVFNLPPVSAAPLTPQWDTARVPGRPPFAPPTQGPSNRRWLLIGLGAGGGFLLLLVTALVLYAFLGRGGAGGPGGSGLFSSSKPKPTNLVGNWSGVVGLDIGGAQIPFQFVCSDEGKIRYGMAGVMIPFEIDSTSWSSDGWNAAGVTQFSCTADSCNFTVREKKGADIQGEPGDLKFVNPTDNSMTFKIWRSGDHLEAEITQPGVFIALRGKLYKN